MPDWDDFDRMMDKGMKKLDRAMDDMDGVFDKTSRRFDKTIRAMDERFKRPSHIRTETHMMDKLRMIGWIIKGAVASFVILIAILVWGMFSSYQTEKAHEPKELNPPAIEEVKPEEVKPQPGSMKKL